MDLRRFPIWVRAAVVRLAAVGFGAITIDFGRAEASLGAGVLYTGVALALASAMLMAAFLRPRIAPRVPDAPVLSGPPPGISPVAGALLLDGTRSEGRLLAMICDLSLRGVLRLQGTPDGWVAGVVDLSEGGGVSPAERQVLSALGLGAPGALFVYSKAKDSQGKARVAQTLLDHHARREVLALMKPDPWWWTAVLAAGGAAAVWSVFLPEEGYRGPSSSEWLVTHTVGLWLLVFVVLLADVFVDRARSKRRTAAGMETAVALRGFRRGLMTESARARFAYAKDAGLLAPGLQWAIAFGLSPEWRVAPILNDDEPDASAVHDVLLAAQPETVVRRRSVPPPA